MRLPDTNVLLHAVNEDSPRHETARDWIETALTGDETVGFAWLALLGFVRIATKEAIFPKPLSPTAALDLVDGWLSAGPATIASPGDNHASILRELIERAGTAGNLTSDAHLAAIAVERGARIATFDTDFHRFRGLRVDYLG